MAASDDSCILIAQHGDTQCVLRPDKANRHGLITGATGTGKTITLQTMAEGFSRKGVPVFLADIKGDLTGISQCGQIVPKLDQMLAERKLPFITLLTDPTMGGVSASFAFMGDLVIGEPGALIGFAGPRVIEQTVRETLPPGFQRSEFLLEKGAIDLIIDRRELRDRLAELLTLLTRQASVRTAS